MLEGRGKETTMNAHSASEDSGPTASEQLREQIAEDRRALTETLSALQGKTDVKKSVRDKAASVEIVAADVVSRAGRTACSLPHLAKSAAHQAQQQAAEQAHKVPEPVRAPVESVVVVLRRRPGVVLAAWAAILAAVVTMRRWHGR
jgi:hypothetical protein